MWAEPSRSLTAAPVVGLVDGLVPVDRVGLRQPRHRRVIAHPNPRLIGSPPQSSAVYRLTAMYRSPTMIVFDVPSGHAGHVQPGLEVVDPHAVVLVAERCWSPLSVEVP